MSLRRVFRRSLLVATVLSLMLSLVPLLVAPAAAQDGCYGDYYPLSKWITALTPVGGGVPIVRGGDAGVVEICYSGGQVSEIYVSIWYPGDVGVVNAYIVEPAWKIAGASGPKPVATLKTNSGPQPSDLGGGGVVVLPGGANGYMQAGTTATFGINYNNGNLTVRFDGKVCDSNGNCFKFKTEIKAYYDADYNSCRAPQAIPGGVRPAC